MHAAHIITRFIRGGADENTQLTCNHQAQAGYDVTLISGRQWDSEMRDTLDPRVRFIVVPSMTRPLAPFSDIASLVEMYLLLRRLKPDVVHTHTSKAGFIGRVAAWLAGVRRIVHGVHILPFMEETVLRRTIYLWLERICGWLTDAFVHVSGGMRDECLRRGIGRSARHIVAESGMDVARFRNASPPDDEADLLRSPCDAEQRPFVIVSLAVLESRKGLRQFLPVFRQLVERRPNSVLLLAGEGSEREEIEADVQVMNLTRHVRLLGYRTDPERLLSIADTLIVCSDREGLPRAAVQAAIAGVPIVSTALPGIDTIVRHDESGFIVPIGQLNAMENPLLRLIDDPSVRLRMRAHLRTMDFSRWTTESMTERIEALYASLMKEQSEPSPQSSSHVATIEEN